MISLESVDVDGDILKLQKNKIKLIKNCKQPYIMNFLNKEIIVFPNVFYPATDTKLLIETVKTNGSELVLEPCSGTGVISIFLAKNVKEIIATDISNYAVENIKANINKYNLNNIKVLQADIFPKNDFKFDLIIINPPYSDRQANDLVERSMFDKGNSAVKKLLRECRNYLKKNGKIYLSWANFADFEFIESLAIENKFNIKILSELKKENKIYRVYELT